MAAPILTIGDVEPERPTISISRNAPDGRWQAFKYRHLDWLLRWFPVRFAFRRDLYPLRLPSEFGLRTMQRLSAMQKEIDQLRAEPGAAADRRLLALMRDMTAMVLVAPRDVIEALHPNDYLAILAVFPRAVTGTTPTSQPDAENPSTSAPSSRGSTASTAPGTG